MKSNRTPRLQFSPVLLLALAAFALSGCDDSQPPLDDQKGSEGHLSSANWKDIKAKAAAFQARRAVLEAEQKKNQQRIDFAMPDFPAFIESVDGLSTPEPWGRWTDARFAPALKLTFKEALPNTFLLELKGAVAGPLAGKKFKLQAGTQTIEFSLKEQDARRPQSVILRVAGAEDLRVLEIIPPETVVPKTADPANNDERQLALALVSLTITRLADQAPAPSAPVQEVPQVPAPSAPVQVPQPAQTEPASVTSP